MTIAIKMVHQVIHGETRQEQVNALATLIMWFSAGAFVTSTLAQYVIPHHSGTPADIIGGVLVAGAAAMFKAT